jgi:hypothetical protein
MAQCPVLARTVHTVENSGNALRQVCAFCEGYSSSLAHSPCMGRSEELVHELHRDQPERPTCALHIYHYENMASSAFLESLTIALTTLEPAIAPFRKEYDFGRNASERPWIGDSAHLYWLLIISRTLDAVRARTSTSSKRVGEGSDMLT